MSRQSPLTQRIDALVARASLAPIDSQKLWFGDSAVGWINAETCLTLLTQGEGFTLLADGLHWPLPAGLAAATVALSQIDGVLRRHGLVGAARHELLDVQATSASGNERRLGAIDRAAVRRLGLTTLAVHLVAYDPADAVWVAQRALDKTTDPGLWDTLVSGLRAGGETIEQALRRESAEEAGLDASHLSTRQWVDAVRLGRPLAEGYQDEWQEVFDVTLPPGFTPCNQDGEVISIRKVSRRQILDGIVAGVFTLEAALALLLSFAARGWVREGDRQLLARLPRRSGACAR